MNTYRLAQQAREDIQEIRRRIAQDNPTAARRVLDALRRTFQVVARNPRIGRSRDDLRPGLHVFPAQRPAQNYVIFYYPSPNGIEISTVLHGHRDWEGMFSRGEI